ncbi:peptidylprolyl isomerase [Xylanimonas ulmi]|uniref:Peptidyl-prolyl cis-trans isomerase B (Cyclophilin B) n=1 Tax=Xylanimonas ulmi TaxID=228973 RepID=A0A4Q7M2A3_9MICO|nr:peptidylprolyl isomerase [Xylanibacterium ulmi]RZS60957.1 peptidyl-prolyl cis-trans isomerase B (cyclophilin B) [Xylanibacterium ulmi]
MAATKRERELARKRQARWEAKQQQRRRRQRLIGTITAGAAVLALVVTMAIVGLGGNQSPGAAADASPTPGATATFTLPDPSFAENRTWTATLSTSAGEIQVELDGQAAPQAVASFVSLAQQGFFDDTSCHRLTTAGIFVLQCGDPTGTGTGGPGYTFGPIENAPADDVYPAGALAMARVGGDGASMGSQFFLVYQDSTIPSDNAGGYTVFGRITSGLDVVQAVADAGVAGGGSDGPPATPVTIEGVDTK